MIDFVINNSILFLSLSGIHKNLVNTKVCFAQMLKDIVLCTPGLVVLCIHNTYVQYTACGDLCLAMKSQIRTDKSVSSCYKIQILGNIVRSYNKILRSLSIYAAAASTISFLCPLSHNNNRNKFS